MPDCEKCGKRPGGKWRSGGYTCLCGPCKFSETFSGPRGARFAQKLSAEATLATGQNVSVELKFDPGGD